MLNYIYDNLNYYEKILRECLFVCFAFFKGKINVFCFWAGTQGGRDLKICLI